MTIKQELEQGQDAAFNRAVAAIEEIDDRCPDCMGHNEHDQCSVPSKEVYLDAVRAAMGTQPAPAAQAPAVVEPGWLPIETAPKDGECLLWVATDDGGEVMKLVRDKNGDWLYEGEQTYATGFYIEPTHWMPLPPPPAATKGATE